MSVWIFAALGVAYSALAMRSVKRRNPRKALWATVAIMVAPVAYPLSLGPACWISSHSGRGAEIVSIVYEPLIFDSPRFLGRGFEWYSLLRAAKSWHWRLVSGGWTNLPRLRETDP